MKPIQEFQRDLAIPLPFSEGDIVSYREPKEAVSVYVLPIYNNQ